MTNLYIDDSSQQEQKFEKYTEVLRDILNGKSYESVSDAYNEVQEFFKGMTNVTSGQALRLPVDLSSCL